LCLAPAARAGRGVHLARLAEAAAAAAAAALATATATTTAIRAATGLFTSRPALWAAARCIGQATAGIKFLFTCGKSEFLIAVATIQNLIGQEVFSLSYLLLKGSNHVFSLYCAPLPSSIFSLKHLSSFF
jgi:hypothetical protein